ncbi:MAG: PDZ domain-containing protein, partial [Myxococcales bacterium]|nr:PDZ domain-containing protein [Myxococcales bacterium]
MLLLPRSQRLWISIGCFAAALALTVAMDFGADRGPFFQAATAKTDRAGTYDLAKGRFLSRVIGHVRAHYVDPDRIAPREMAVAALVAIQRDVPEVMVTVERDKKSKEPVSVDVVADAAKKTFALDRVGDLYELNWKLLEIYEFLEKNLPAQANLQDVEFSSVNGLLSTLDPHSLLLPPRIYREMQLGQKGRFGGLGLSIGVDDGTLAVMSVMPETPAAESGVQAGDLILQIDAESTVSMTLSEAANLLRGEPGTKVTLWLRRDGWDQAKPVELTRREISVSSVDDEPLPDGLGYVHIRNFQENTGEDLRAALERLQARKGGLTGLVLDLRDNPGGLLDQAIAVSDTFIDHGTIVTTVREGAREREENHATSANTLSELPIVVLINRGSASASEIVAGALKRNDRAVILGERSFGKGSVQVVYKIDEAALKLTIAQYLTPGDLSIQSVGIIPDIDVIPIAVGAGDLDLHPASADDKGEAGLASHLDNARAREDIRPAAQLRLLESGDAEGSHHRRRGEPFVEDARVKLAHELLLAAPAPNRKQALIQATGFLARRQATEEARLVAELQKVGVDWRAGEAVGKPRVDTKLEIRA